MGRRRLRQESGSPSLSEIGVSGHWVSAVALIFAVGDERRRRDRMVLSRADRRALGCAGGYRTITPVPVAVMRR